MPGVARAAPPRVQTSAEATAQDGAEYARRFGVTQTEAEQRLRAQEASIAITTELARLHAGRLTGIALEHQPTLRIVVLLKGDAPVPDMVVQAAGLPVPVSFRTGAEATREELSAALVTHQGEIAAALPHPPGMGLDQRTGEIVVVAAQRDIDRIGGEALRQRLRAIAGVPVRLQSVEWMALAKETGGGARVVGTNPADGLRYSCTTGFVVSDGARTGVATAAHCPDALIYAEIGGSALPLSFVGQWGWGHQDVQVNVSERPLAPRFFADTAKTLARPVMGQRSLASTRAGDFVCHRGERTGYSCAPVELVQFAPAGQLCGGACTPTWVTVAGPGCGSGDSGSPVFGGNRAFGIMKGGSYRADKSCAFYFYMSTDYLPENWRLVLETVQQVPLDPPSGLGTAMP